MEAKKQNELCYDKVNDFSEGLAAVELNGKYGFINEEGDEVIKLEYDYADSFYGGRAFVEVDGFWGAIDKTGCRIVPPKYEEIDDYGFCNGLVAVCINYKWGFIDIYGNEIVSPIYDEVDQFNDDGLAIVGLNRNIIMEYSSRGVKKYYETGIKYGVIEKIGEEIVEPKYDEIDGFYNGVAAVRLNDKWGLIDRNGNEITPIKYDIFDELYDWKEAIVAKIDDKYGLINLTGEEITPIKYDWIGEFSEGFVNVYENGKGGFVDTSTGKEVIPLIYGDTSDFRDGFAGVELNGKWGIFDNTGKKITPFLFDEISAYKGNNRWIVYKDDSCGLLEIKLKKDVTPLAEDLWEWGFLKES